MQVIKWLAKKMRLNMEEASVISITVIMLCNYVNLNVVSCKSFGEPSLGNAVEFLDQENYSFRLQRTLPEKDNWQPSADILTQ